MSQLGWPLPWGRTAAGNTDPAAGARKRVESGEAAVRLGGHGDPKAHSSGL